jgi:hypothetical protein
MTVQHVEHDLDAPETVAWGALVTAWWARFRDEEVCLDDLFPVALGVEGLDLGKGRKRARLEAFEQLLAGRSGRVLEGYRVTPNRAVRGVQMWRLLRTAPESVASAPFVPSAEWQIVPDGFPCPPGGEFNMNFQTGITLGRWPALATP